MSDIDLLLRKFSEMHPAEHKEMVAAAMNATAGMKWIPNPGPQTEAYYCKADQLLYGGEPGGGKSQLLVGLAFNCQQRSLIMRRQYTDLGQLTDDAIAINGSRDGFNGSAPPKLRISERQFIDFAAAARVGDEQSWMGRAHDFIGYDEATQFAESQVRFVMGWLRTEDPNQRCRVVLASNPPLTAEGLWIIKMFAPWLDPTHPRPARVGELRWFINDEHGDDKWVEGPEPIQVGGKMVRPMSRTYIPASVSDNPRYAATNYQRTLDAMHESVRSILLGGFRTTFRDQAWQTIPTKWIQLAQERWTRHPPDGLPMCSIAADATGGGTDPMVVIARYDGWFSVPRVVPGRDIPAERAGSYGAGIVLQERRDDALVIVDMGGGYGGPTYEHLHSNEIPVKAYKGAEATIRRTADKKLKFVNVRSAAIYGMREALDPGQPGGSSIMLPPDPEIVADLAAPTYEITPNGIKVEAKEKVCDRLGRSTNKGDAVCMAWWDGARHITHAEEWIDRAAARAMRGQRPRVLMGRTPLSARGANGR